MTLDNLFQSVMRARLAGVEHIQLVADKGSGRFPMLGGGTELLCVNHAGQRVYLVPIKRVQTFIDRALKELRETETNAAPPRSHERIEGC